MNYIYFNIECWQALSPGLVSMDEWKNWAKNEQQWPEILEPVPATNIPAMLRRRMSILSKLALQTAVPLTKGNEIDYIIFSSRHGELHRTVKLLTDVLQGEDASPIAFSQSVHNTAAGLFTIATKKSIPAASIAAGEHSLHSALIEASAYLSEKPKDRVLVVDFDEPLPEVYQEFEVANYHAFALGMIITKGNQYQVSWEAKGKASDKNAVVTSFPQTLDVITHLVEEHDSWEINGQRMNWNWTR